MLGVPHPEGKAPQSGAGPRWEQAFSAAVDPMLVVGDDMRFVDLNLAASALLGYSRAELVGHPLEEVVAPRQRDRISRAWARFLVAGQDRGEWLVQARDGRLVSVEASAAAHIQAGRHLIVLRDVTERKRIEAEAVRRADQQEAVANIGQVALTDVTVAHLMQLATEEISRVLEIEFVNVLELQRAGGDLVLRAGVGWADGVVGDEAIPSTAGQGAFVIASPEPVVVSDLETETRFEVPPLLHDHGIHSGLCVVIEGSKQPFGVLGVHSRERRAFSGDDIYFVRSVAQVLGAALARERLRRLEGQLEQSRRLESIGQLAGGIAHDFNNLLGIIVSYSSFALEELDPGSQLHRDISEVVTAAEHGAELTKQLLLFSSRQVVKTRTVDPNEVVRDAESILSRTLGDHIELRTNLAEAIAPVRLGNGQLEQILINLATNARDAMPDGGVLTIETETLHLDARAAAPDGSLPDGPTVRISVSDTGTGMSDDVIRQAFEPFYTTKERGQGTGLGLATVYGIAQAAGGRVLIDSQPNRGTTVNVYIPTSEELPAAEVAARPSQLQGFGEVVLLVEDDASVRRATERILSDNGYVVTAVADGAEALRVSDVTDRVDILLTDVVMPRLSGIELAARVRAKRPELAVVYVSGYARSAFPNGEQLDPGALLVEKPFTESTLLAGLRAALDAASSGGGATVTAA
jgi:PAS domain S-box-containing protein